MTVRYDDHEPARCSANPVEEEWDTRAYLRHSPTVFEEVRNEFGPELPLLHDAHHRLTPIQAANLGKSLHYQHDPNRCFISDSLISHSVCQDDVHATAHS